MGTWLRSEHSREAKPSPGDSGTCAIRFYAFVYARKGSVGFPERGAQACPRSELSGLIRTYRSTLGSGMR